MSQKMRAHRPLLLILHPSSFILSRTRPAFTLIEVLIVILIIGLLVGLLLPALGGAFGRANTASVQLEITQLANAIEANQHRAGGYPPCMGDNTATVRHARFMNAVQHRWTRFTTQTTFGAAGATPTNGLRKLIQDNFIAAGAPAGSHDIEKLDQAEALVFWLGGMPGIAGVHATKLIGFGAAVQNPFAATGTREPPLYEFDPDRLTDQDGDGWWEYVPDLDVSTNERAPYVYFDSHVLANVTYRAYPAPILAANVALGLPTLAHTGPGAAAEWGVAVPYCESPIPVLLNRKTFQIVAAGEDGQFGQPGVTTARYPVASSGMFLTAGDADNLANCFAGVVANERK